MEKAFSESRSGEAGPAMRAALDRASGRLEVDRFAQEQEESVTLEGEGELDLTRPVCRWRWFAHFERLAILLVPKVAAPPRTASLSLTGRRVREWNSSAEQRQTAVRRGLRFKAACRASGRGAAEEDAVARGRDVAPSSSVSVQFRL